jgi:hypothetical protein
MISPVNFFLIRPIPKTLNLLEQIEQHVDILRGKGRRKLLAGGRWCDDASPRTDTGCHRGIPAGKSSL